MSNITNLGTLKTAIANWLARDGDPQLTARLNDFISFGMNRVYYGTGLGGESTRPLRVRQMEKSADMNFFTAGPPDVPTDSADLPADFLEFRRFFLKTNPLCEPQYVEPPTFTEYTSEPTVKGLPRFMTLEGNQIKLAPFPDGAYVGKISYYGRFPALVNDTDTNWLLTNHPEIYLYAALLETSIYTRNEERAQTWFQAFKGYIEALNSSERLGARVATGFRMRVRF